MHRDVSLVTPSPDPHGYVVYSIGGTKFQVPMR
jgi:hypothetical protein